MRVVKNVLITVLILIIYVGHILFGLAVLDMLYVWKFGQDEVWLVTGNATVIPWIFFIGWIALFLWLFAPKGISSGLGEWTKCGWQREKRIVAAILYEVALALAVLFPTLWYDKFTLDGVESRSLFSDKVYGWEDVASFSLSGDVHGVLVFHIRMEDGRTKYFNGGLIRTGEFESEAFDGMFPDGNYDYTVWLASEFAGRGISFDESGWDKMLKNLDYDSWVELAEEIRETYYAAAE